MATQSFAGPGILGVDDVTNAWQNQIIATIQLFYVNFAPIFSRFPKVPVATPDFNIVGYGFRPRVATLASDLGSSTAGTGDTLTLADSSFLAIGDVVELPTGEQVECTADPNTGTGTIAIRRGVGLGVSASVGATTLASNAQCYIISNSRTGKEVSQNAAAWKPTSTTQHTQVVQKPVQVGGTEQATFQHLPPGQATPFSGQKQDQLTEWVRDFETAVMYAKGESYNQNGATRRKMFGLKSLIAAANVTTSPVNAAAYKPDDLTRDLLEKAKTGQGYPDLILASTDMLTGFATWGHAIERVPAGANELGVETQMLFAPFLGGIPIIEAPLMRSKTIMALTSSDVNVRMLRPPFWQERGARGDAFEGDWIGEGAIELRHPTYHTWVEGITGFSAN